MSSKCRLWRWYPDSNHYVENIDKRVIIIRIRIRIMVKIVQPLCALPFKVSWDLSRPLKQVLPSLTADIILVPLFENDNSFQQEFNDLYLANWQLIDKTWQPSLHVMSHFSWRFLQWFYLLVIDCSRCTRSSRTRTMRTFKTIFMKIL